MKTINKVLAGHEDIAIGQGVTAQQREGNIVNVTQVELSWIFRSTTEIRSLDITKYTRVQLHQTGAALEYWYDPTSNAADDGYSVLEPASLPTLGRWLLVIGSGGGSGDYIPLAGTNAGQSVTGPIFFQNTLGADVFKLQTDIFGPDIMGFVADTEGTFVIAPKNDAGALEAFNFTKDGLFSIPSPSSDNAWSMQALEYNGDLDTLFIAPINALGNYGNHDLVMQPGVGVRFLVSKDGYLEAPRTTDPGDPDNAFTTKAFVESILPPGGGEANTASSPAASGADLVLPKVSVDLQFKTLVAGTDVTLIENADNIVINSSGGGGGGLPAGVLNQTLRNDASTNTWAPTSGILIDDIGHVGLGPGAGVSSLHGLTVAGDALFATGCALALNDVANSTAGILFNDVGRLKVNAPAGGGLDLKASANGTPFTLESAAHVAMSVEYSGNTTVLINYNGDKRIKTQSNGVELTGGLTVRNDADTINVMDVRSAGITMSVETTVEDQLNCVSLYTTVGGVSSADQVIINGGDPTQTYHAARKAYVDNQISTHTHNDVVTTNTSQTVTGVKTFSQVLNLTGGIGSYHNGGALGYHSVFYHNGPSVGSITSNSSSTNYNTTSDYRLKDDCGPVAGDFALEALAAVDAKCVTWKDSGIDDIAFLAHEMQAWLPTAVTGHKDGDDLQQMDYSKVVTLLWAQNKAQQTRLEALEQLVEELLDA